MEKYESVHPKILLNVVINDRLRMAIVKLLNSARVNLVLIAGLIVTAIHANDNEMCPPRPNCFEYCYSFVDNMLNFEDAMKYCNDINMDLVSIYSDAENKFVARLVFSEMNAKGLSSYANVWTAGYTPMFNISEFAWHTSFGHNKQMIWTGEFNVSNEKSAALLRRPAAILLTQTSDFKDWTCDTPSRLATSVCRSKFPEWFNMNTKCPIDCDEHPGPIGKYGPTPPNWPCPPDTHYPTTNSTTTQTTVATTDDNDQEMTNSTTDATITTTESITTAQTTESTSTSTTTKSIATTQTTESAPTNPTTESATTLHEQHCGPTEEAGIEWPETSPGSVSVQPCPQGSTGNATWFCEGRTGTFQPAHFPNLSKCKHDAITELESEVANGDYSVMNITLALEDEVVSSGDLLYGQDLISVQDILKDVISKAENDIHNSDEGMSVTNITGCVVNICSQVLLDVQMPAWLSIQRADRVATANLLTENIDRVGFLDMQLQINQSRGYSNTFSYKNLELTVEITDARSSHFYNTSRFGVAVYVPPESIEENDLKIVIAAYNNLQTLLKGEEKLQETNESEKLANSHVIGVSINAPGYEVKFPNDGIELYFSTINPSLEGDSVCAFWTFSQDGGVWDKQGCHLKEQKGNITICSCEHLTNFAILMDFHGSLETANYKVLIALKYLTIIGCTLSTMCLIANIIIFHFVKSLQSVRSTITKNICICLLFANLTLLTGLESTEHEITCAVVAAMLLYDYLATFTWMLMAGIHLYRLLHRVFETTRRVEYYLAGYGIPLILVIFTGSMFPEDFGTKDFCWLNMDGTVIWFFGVPISVVIALNVVFLTLALRASHKVHKTINAGKKRRYYAKQCLRGSFHLTSILGLTWVFGFIISDTSIAFAFIFTIVNSTQGMAIFVSQCIVSEQTRTATVTAIARLRGRIRCNKSIRKQNSMERDCMAVCPTARRQSAQILTTPVSSPRTSTGENILNLPTL